MRMPRLGTRLAWPSLVPRSHARRVGSRGEQTMATCEKSVAVCCPVCYREYSDSDADLVPRILHCGHSYCTECLQRLLEVEGEESGDGWRATEDLFGFLTASGRGRDLRLQLQASPWGRGGLRRSHSPADEVTCPVCKRSNHIQGGEVTSLTKNFALLGVQEGVERAAISQHYCQEHDHEQRIYCEDCQQLVCAYCQLYGRHQTHKCLIATEACQPAVHAVRGIHAEVESELRELERSEAAVLASVQQLEHGRQCTERGLCYYYDQLVEALQQKRAAEVERVQVWSDEQAYVLQAQLRSLSGARKTCSRLLDDCHRIADCDPLQALCEKESLGTRAETIKTTCNGLPRKPIITPSIHSQQQPGSTEHLQALMNNFSVTMSLDPADQEEEEEEGLASSTELSGPLLHAQDTQHTAGQPGMSFSTDDPKLGSGFPVDPSPSLASPASTPASYSATQLYCAATVPLYSTHQYSPTSSNSEDSTGGEEFRALRLRHPLSFLMNAPTLWYAQQPTPPHSVGHDEAAELADDECENDVILDQSHPVSPPSPPTTSLSVPSISPTAGLLANSRLQAGEERQRVNVSIAGQGLHISVSGSAWPHLSTPSLHPSTLFDNGEALLVDDSD